MIEIAQKLGNIHFAVLEGPRSYFQTRKTMFPILDHDLLLNMVDWKISKGCDNQFEKPGGSCSRKCLPSLTSHISKLNSSLKAIHMKGQRESYEKAIKFLVSSYGLSWNEDFSVITSVP